MVRRRSIEKSAHEINVNVVIGNWSTDGKLMLRVGASEGRQIVLTPDEREGVWRVDVGDISSSVSQLSVVYLEASSEQWLCLFVCLKQRVTEVTGGEGYLIPMRVLGVNTLSSLVLLAPVVSCHHPQHTTLAPLRTSLPNLQQSGVRRRVAWAGGGGGARGVRAQSRARGVVVAMATGTITPVEVLVKAAVGQPDQLGDCEFFPSSLWIEISCWVKA